MVVADIEERMFVTSMYDFDANIKTKDDVIVEGDEAKILRGEAGKKSE